MKPMKKVSQSAHDHYALLVEKKYTHGLSPAEQAEMKRLQGQLDRADAPFYEPIERRLESVLTRLRQSPKR